jgi:SNF2 family DNA or RNA helicase
MISTVVNRPITHIKDLLWRIRETERLGEEVILYPDAEEFIGRRLYHERIKDKITEIRKDPKNHPLRKTLLKVELLPYQLDGIAFSVGAGRAVLADDMGLGKTIQGIGMAEMLFTDAAISKVLVICPASLKSYWHQEILRFSGRSCQLILGTAEERATQYDNAFSFTVCNYEQVLRDLPAIERVKWDLIILDEGQRIKNWEAKTS